jgi:hypothetical protein
MKRLIGLLPLVVTLVILMITPMSVHASQDTVTAHIKYADGSASTWTVSVDTTSPAKDIAHACNSVDPSTQGVLATVNGNQATYYFYPGSPYKTSPNGQCVQFFVRLRHSGYTITFP